MGEVYLAPKSSPCRHTSFAHATCILYSTVSSSIPHADGGCGVGSWDLHTVDRLLQPTQAGAGRDVRDFACRRHGVWRVGRVVDGWRV